MKIELIKGYHDGPQTVEVQKETTARTCIGGSDRNFRT